jgi:tripartite-type tricarboxylate transporter receptor subunit TctC
MLADAPNILVVTPPLNVRSVAELVALAKQPGRNLAFGSSGAGTSLHLCGELLRVRTGAAMTHVPYRGSAPALTALMSGEVPMMFDSLATALPLIQAGSIRAMAVTTKERSPILPDVPTMAESGFPDFDVSVWFGLFGPAGLPRPVVERLAAVVDAYLNDPRTAGQLQPLSMAIRRLPGPAAFRDFFVGDMQRWKDIVTSTGVTVG